MTRCCGFARLFDAVQFIHFSIDAILNSNAIQAEARVRQREAKEVPEPDRKKGRVGQSASQSQPVSQLPKPPNSSFSPHTNLISSHWQQLLLLL